MTDVTTHRHDVQVSPTETRVANLDDDVIRSGDLRHGDNGEAELPLTGVTLQGLHLCPLLTRVKAKLRVNIKLESPISMTESKVGRTWEKLYQARNIYLVFNFKKRDNYLHIHLQQKLIFPNIRNVYKAECCFVTSNVLPPPS